MRELERDFISISPNIQEDHSSNNPIVQVENNSRKKAENVAKDYPHHLIIGADTIVVLGSKILGKPRDKKDAIKMLELLSGNTHTVYTGITVIDTSKRKSITKTASTKVYFRKIAKQQINDYVDTGEPLDKAGSYAIQGLGRMLVDHIQGSYSNVVGLPTELLLEVLSELE